LLPMADNVHPIGGFLSDKLYFCSIQVVETLLFKIYEGLILKSRVCLECKQDQSLGNHICRPHLCGEFASMRCSCGKDAWPVSRSRKIGPGPASSTAAVQTEQLGAPLWAIPEGRNFVEASRRVLRTAHAENQTRRDEFRFAAVDDGLERVHASADAQLELDRRNLHSTACEASLRPGNVLMSRRNMALGHVESWVLSVGSAQRCHNNNA